MLNTAPYIRPTVLDSTSTPPELHGGTIADGTHEVVAVEYYPGDASAPPQLFHRTAQFTDSGQHLALVELELVEASVGESYWWQVYPSFEVSVDGQGSLVAAFDACFSASVPENRYCYEANAREVTMWYERGRLMIHYV